jgi:hypothetical protein
MRRVLRIVTVAAVLLALLIVGQVVRLSFDRGSDIHRPRGYELVTSLFLRHRWIALDENMKAAVEAAAGESAVGMFRRSFLRDDVEAFNGGETWIFQVENQQIKAVDATRHNVVLPFGNLDRWDGNLRYRPSSQLEASLRGVGIDIRIDSLTSPLLSHVEPATIEVRGDPRVSPVRRARGEVVNLFGDPNRVYLGKVNLAGESIVVNNRNSPDTLSMWISGTRLPSGNRAWLEPGELLKLEWRSGGLRPTRYALLWSEGGRSADILSAPCAVNGRWDRCPEEPAIPFARDVVATLDAGVAGKTTDARRDFDVVLTLDRQLHEDVQRALEEDRQAERDAPTTGLAARRRETRAAVTVMDALTGDILALASYPTRAALERVDLPAETESRLLRNHNFSRLAVGSVAKIPLSVAIADADPRLLTLELRQHAGEMVDTIAGITIDPPIESHAVSDGGDGTVNLREFLGHSSNEYAAVLLTLACATKRGAPLPEFTGPELTGEGRYSIEGKAFERTPSPTVNEIRLNLFEDEKRQVVADTLSTLEGEEWANSFQRIFAIDKITNQAMNQRPVAEGDQLMDTATWAPVMAQLYGDHVPANHPFRAIGFERENLALNLSETYRKEFLSLMYGGAAARFTNPKLCEMFSRLVTGRQVERSLVHGVTANGAEVVRPPRELAPLQVDPNVRREVLAGMASVADGGTAVSLFDTLQRIDNELRARNQALGFFSKTGSPRNTITVPSSLSRAVNALIRSGAVSLDAQGVLTYRGTPVTDDAERGTVSRSLAALRANAADVRAINRFGVTTRLVHDTLLLYNVEPPDRRNALFVTRNGRVFSMNGVREILATGATYVFTIAVYDGAARRSTRTLDVDAVGHAPLRAWTVAINIEGQGKSTEVAVPFAEDLIQRVLWPALKK